MFFGKWLDILPLVFSYINYQPYLKYFVLTPTPFDPSYSPNVKKIIVNISRLQCNLTLY